MRAKLVLTIVCLVAAVLLGSVALTDRPTRAADPPRATEVGRYQLLQKDGRPTYLFDTATGRVWEFAPLEVGGNWRPYMNAPAR